MKNLKDLPDSVEQALNESHLSPRFVCGPMKIKLTKDLMIHLTEVTEREIADVKNRKNLNSDVIVRAFDSIGSFSVYHRVNQEFKDFLKACAVKYAELLDIKELLEGRGSTAPFGSQNKERGEIKITGIWGISNREYDYNPVHWHYGKLSGVIYIKVPEQIIDGTREKEFGIAKQHGVADGKLEIIYGSSWPFAFHSVGNAKICPIEGNMYLFPAWLLHTVYPFKGEGERRIVSFNLDW